VVSVHGEDDKSLSIDRGAKRTPKLPPGKRAL